MEANEYRKTHGLLNTFVGGEQAAFQVTVNTWGLFQS